jgi:hypothetical protein
MQTDTANNTNTHSTTTAHVSTFLNELHTAYSLSKEPSQVSPPPTSQVAGGSQVPRRSRRRRHRHNQHNQHHHHHHNNRFQRRGRHDAVRSKRQSHTTRCTRQLEGRVAEYMATRPNR